jgi:Transposase and inactivated derivatives
MAAAIGVRSDYTSADLRQFARRSDDADQVRRLLAVALILDGGSRSEAAKVAGVALQIVRDWVLRFAAANIYSAFHKNAEAMRAYDKAIALKPEAYIYLNRSLRRPKSDLAGRRRDIDAALKLEPNYTEAISQKADLQAENGDLTGAISTYSAALQKSPDDLALLLGHRDRLCSFG